MSSWWIQILGQKEVKGIKKGGAPAHTHTNHLSVRKRRRKRRRKRETVLTPFFPPPLMGQPKSKTSFRERREPQWHQIWLLLFSFPRWTKKRKGAVFKVPARPIPHCCCWISLFCLFWGERRGGGVRSSFSLSLFFLFRLWPLSLSPLFISSSSSPFSMGAQKRGGWTSGE